MHNIITMPYVYLIRYSASSICHSNTHCHILISFNSWWHDLQIRILESGVWSVAKTINFVKSYKKIKVNIQSISKWKQWHSFKITICSVDHWVVCDIWNLCTHTILNNVCMQGDASGKFLATWSRLAGQVLGSLPAGLITPVRTSTRALPPVWMNNKVYMNSIISNNVQLWVHVHLSREEAFNYCCYLGTTNCPWHIEGTSIVQH